MNKPLRYEIRYLWRGKVKRFTTVASCEQVAVRIFSKDKALQDCQILQCEPIKV